MQSASSATLRVGFEGKAHTQPERERSDARTVESRVSFPRPEPAPRAGGAANPTPAPTPSLQIRSAYDLVVDVNGPLIKLQVKSAWFSQKTGNYVVDNRRTKTNRRRMIRATYCSEDFDFAVLYISELDISYVIPVEEFCKYGSEIHLVEVEKRQRRPGSNRFRDAWSLVESFRRDQFRPAVLPREKLSCS